MIMIKNNVLLTFFSLVAAATSSSVMDAQCHQVAYFMSTSNEACVRTAATTVQNDVFRGRNGFAVENISNQGGWVRYWRVDNRFSRTATILTGTCADRSRFTVDNCQWGGVVKY